MMSRHLERWQREKDVTQLHEPVGDQKVAVSVRKARQDEAGALSAVLARAFDDDPFANWAVAQDSKREDRILSFMSLAMRRMTLPHGHVYTTDGTDGVAGWTPPGKWKLGMLQQLMLAPQMARSTSWRRLPKVIGGLNVVEKKHPHQPHYYLLVVGVEPALQGRSIGTQLMAPVLALCDRESMPAYLESSKERNVPLYERNGFRVTEELTIPNGGPRLWLMWREPQ